MRIISGNNRGRKIIAPANLPVRPTTDMAKESLFNIISNNHNISNIRVLDLFSGTGNISYEFASRNCKSVTAIDSNYKCVNFIEQTSKKLGFNNFSVLKYDYKVFIKNTYEKWDIIFADPPYSMAETENIPALISENDLLNKDGWLIIEHDQKINFSSLPEYFDHRVYGKVNFSFFRRDPGKFIV